MRKAILDYFPESVLNFIIPGNKPIMKGKNKESILETIDYYSAEIDSMELKNVFNNSN